MCEIVFLPSQDLSIFFFFFDRQSIWTPLSGFSLISKKETAGRRLGKCPVSVY